jgi:menaquinone-9 beta-reductase
VIPETDFPNQFDADVLIAGAGPSGAICAHYLAQAGRKVLLIDAETFPREKICGGFVSPIGLQELTKIGASDKPAFLNANIIRCAAVHIDGEKLITDSIPVLDGLVNYGRVFTRTELDTLVLNAAIGEGAEFIPSCRFEKYSVTEDGVQVNCKSGESERTFRVRMLIGADGTNSKVARQLSGKKPNTSKRIIAVRAFFEGVNCTVDQAELYFTSGSFPGYYWYFPLGTDKANAGVGMSLEYFPKIDKSLKELLLEVMEHDPSLKANMGEGKPLGQIEGWPLAIYDPQAELVGDRVLLTGDAAGLINSINGEGIQYALQSGRWAAETVEDCLKRNDLRKRSLRQFDRKIRREIGLDMSLSNLVLQFIRNRYFNPLWMETLQVFIRRALVDKRYAGIAGGVLAGMVPTKMAISPFFIWKTFVQVMADIFKSPKRFLTFILNCFVFPVKIIGSMFRSPGEYANWISGLIRDTVSVLRLL